MMENYFVVLQLPGRGFGLSSNTKNPKHFWGRAVDAIVSGKAKIVSRRNDTGVSEDLANHTKKEKKRKTYVLLNLRLRKREGESSILRKAARSLDGKSSATIIDMTDKSG
ncbi:hypothetical protein [Flavobacterium sp.]|uniref:hypothetical protein n=1 Tax=Flavobacterium sp. TaxID=239 RepID=UPI0040347D23